MPSILFHSSARLISFVLLLICTGCSTLTPNECLSADWYAKGEQAANAGQPVTAFMLHQQDCGKHGINPDRWDFVSGWEAAQADGSS